MRVRGGASCYQLLLLKVEIQIHCKLYGEIDIVVSSAAVNIYITAMGSNPHLLNNLKFFKLLLGNIKQQYNTIVYWSKIIHKLGHNKV